MSGDNRNALPEGFEFEGYRVDRVLGAGGFGITYLAIEIETSRKVAIKEYLPSGLAQRGGGDLRVRPISSAHSEGYQWGLDRFRDEARTLTKFRHPNIVSTLRFFAAHGTAYLVMDYIEGETLGAVLERAGTLSESEILELAGPLLDGLSAVHEAGFLHRDIKPDNIFIRHDNGQPVLLDFGAARQALGQATHTLTVIVSHGYAPFEQYTSKGEHGPWSDVYAVGATLYRCLSGERPPSATDRVDAIFAGKSDPLVPARTVGVERFAQDFLAAIDAALQPQPRERPQSIVDLRAYLAGLGAAPHNAVPSRRGAGTRWGETLVAGADVAMARMEPSFAQGQALKPARASPASSRPERVMNSGTLRMTGIAGLVWGVLAILVFLITILFVARATAGTGTGMIVQIFSLIAALALCWMLFQLSQVYGGGMGAIVCYATIAITVLQVVLTFAGIAGIAGIVTIILFVLQGVGLILVGVFGIMGKRLSSGSYKAFCVLMIVTGASIAVVVLAFLYPLLALATGIVLYVAMNGAAKQAAA